VGYDLRCGYEVARVVVAGMIHGGHQ
jgi:hypothetical protein